jgi:hypothetical protein
MSPNLEMVERFHGRIFRSSFPSWINEESEGPGILSVLTLTHLRGSVSFQQAASRGWIRLTPQMQHTYVHI